MEQKQIIEIKQLRKDTDEIIQRVKELRSGDPLLLQVFGRESSLVITKLQEAVMWMGMCLKAIDEYQGTDNNPYPGSKEAYLYKTVAASKEDSASLVNEMVKHGWECVNEECVNGINTMMFRCQNTEIHKTADNLKL